MNRNKLKLLAGLIFLAFLFSCNSENTQKQKNFAKNKTTESASKAKVILPELEKTPEQIIEEKKQSEIKIHQEKIDKLIEEIYNKRESIWPNRNVNIFSNIKIEDNFFDKAGIVNITFDEEKREGEIYYKKKDTKILEYKITYKEDQAGHAYYVSEIELISQVNIGNVDKEIIEKQIIGNLTDIYSYGSIADYFVEYEAENHPLEYDDLWSTVLFCAEGNFTDSGSDEYLVLFHLEDGDSTTFGTYISEVKIFIVPKYRIAKEYILHVKDIYFSPKFKAENFGFSIGSGYPWCCCRVADFNQNGVNEIYFFCEYGYYDENNKYKDHNFLLFVEFDKDGFKTNYVCPDSYNLSYVDWEQKRIYMKSKNYENENVDSDKFVSVFSWDEDLQKYVLLKKTYELWRMP
ncbi:hypothetical protein [Treponema putidum]|uniref:Lipoprotein n=1 Tax=Treponema putidum TaxID=221027 RepID=A0AAE9SGG8_9SPIR|nr:hypothetical protein [Treponema putidum]AIN93784.1 hypothetical protein JO40_06385 [Treponema putidum]TWI77892.1 clustered lipoprotein [Treponema putidum]UTY30187.1 hypothetical protein E4N75_00370 [Treponema putidum]UTY32643.1 hypothetical protein E4N74_00385 [Treponema putidum]